MMFVETKEKSSPLSWRDTQIMEVRVRGQRSESREGQRELWRMVGLSERKPTFGDFLLADDFGCVQPGRGIITTWGQTAPL